MSFSKFRMVIYLIVAHVKKNPKEQNKDKNKQKVPSVKTKTKRDKQTKTDKQTMRNKSV